MVSAQWRPWRVIAFVDLAGAWSRDANDLGESQPGGRFYWLHGVLRGKPAIGLDTDCVRVRPRFVTSPSAGVS